MYVQVHDQNPTDSPCLTDVSCGYDAVIEDAKTFWTVVKCMMSAASQVDTDTGFKCSFRCFECTPHRTTRAFEELR